MSQVTQNLPRETPGSLPPLRPGEQLDQETFHARYEAMPTDVRAELVGGIVHMQMPNPPHSRTHSKVMGWLVAYEEATPGVEGFDNLTTILGRISEPQPDSCLIVLPEKGGQMSWSKKHADYLEGPPEFVVEIAHSSESLDLHDKRRDYETAGVREYVVVALRQRKVFWFVNEGGVLVETAADSDGVIRSRVFPGLWLDSAAVLRNDLRRMLAVLRQGLATPEHATFVEDLSRR
jgi:Uma2 family endonuclease